MRNIRYIFGFCLLFSSSCYAQMTWYPPVGTWSGPAQLNNALILDSLNQNTSSQSEDGHDQKDTPPTSSFNYNPSRARTRQNLADFIDKNRATDSAGAAQAEQQFAANDVIGAVGGVMRQFGLEQNNVAHAYALYWVVYWGLANKSFDAPSARAMQAVAAQAERGFAANADFAAMNDAQKQQAAEEIMVLTALMDAASEQAKSDPALADQAQKASLEGSRKSGLDLDKMTLTEDGFVPAKPRKRSDASDAAAGEEKALASATPTEDKAGGPNYALIAGAGGLGLGLAFLIGKAAGKKG